MRGVGNVVVLLVILAHVTAALFGWAILKAGSMNETPVHAVLLLFAAGIVTLVMLAVLFNIALLS